MADQSTRSCKACKDRHLKCSQASPCQNCTKAGLDCQKPGPFQFLHSKLPRFPHDQVWLSTSNEVDFVPGSENISFVSDSEDPGTKPSNPPEASSDTSLTSLDECLYITQNEEVSSDESGDSSSNAKTNCSKQHGDLTSSSFIPSGNSGEIDHRPSSSSLHDGQGTWLDDDSSSTDLRQDPRVCLFPLNDADAELVRYFFKTLARWFDFLDYRQQFTAAIYALIPQSTLLLYAVLSVASSHLTLLEDYDPIVSGERHQKCLELLRDRLLCLNGDATLDDDILAATVVLRMGSEFEVLATGVENRCHLHGTQALLHHYENAGSLSRFQKVIAWIGLRQQLIVAFLDQRSVSFPLQHFSTEWDNFPNGEVDWPHLMVYHLADVLNHCCGDKAIGIRDHDRLKSRAEIWLSRRPLHFRPIHYMSVGPLDRFPRCEYLGDVPASAIQYYYLSKIILTNSHPSRWRLCPDSHSLNMELNSIIKDTIRDLCGVGLSNSSCACAIGLASMGILMCRDRFHDPEDQEVFSDIIALARSKHGWQFSIPSRSV